MKEFSLISPEKVRLEFKLAGIGSRFAAAFVDGVFKTILVVFFVVVSCSLWGVGLSGWVDVLEFEEYFSLWGALILLIIFGIVYGYSIFFETIWNGQTPGKRLIKIRVVQGDGSPVTFMQVLVRNMLTIIDQLPFLYAVGMVAVLVTRRNQRLGDLAAGTVVLREKGGSAPPVIDYAVPEAEWAGSARLYLHTITEAEFATLKQYLLRKDELRPEEASQLEHRLVAHFSKKLSIRAAAIDDYYVFLQQVAQLFQAKG